MNKEFIKVLAIILGTILFFTSCVERDFSVKNGNQTLHYDIVLIDNCEYLHSYREFTHKGNCKNH